jgi:branched-chain amino acid transport system ATP-binding protein
MLELTGIHTGYGPVQVLFDVSMKVGPEEIVAIIGPNGSGKSTVLKTLCGLLPTWQGDLFLNGKSLKGRDTASLIESGVTYCPQGNRVFDELTVLENLEIGGYRVPKAELPGRMDAVFTVFPVLKGRMRQNAGKLSGGEQQMLALARALIPNPKLLLLDEPSLGLSPNLIKDVFHKIVEVNRSKGVSILIVEQKVREVLEISNRVYALKVGRISFEGLPGELKDDKVKLKQLFI